MSVLIVTSLGDIVVDLHTDRCPLTSKNFLKLCKMKYYNGCLFHKVEKDFLAQTGDRTGSGEGGDSVYKFLYGNQARFFDDEIHPELKHKRIGTVAMASAGKNLNASQFYFTLREDLDYLDGNHTVFGIVEEEEGLETLAKINEAFVDDKGRPYKNIRVKHTYILEDPFSDPAELSDFIPEKSPEGKPDDEVAPERLEDNWVPLDEKLGTAELEELIRAKEAHTNATILESIGDIPDADIKPPENVLFVCKLNPVTQDEDLHTIFSRFGNVTSADIIRDYKTGDSLCYAFIEFETTEACELAYTKMGDALIDDRRIKVDFSQSVAKLWNQYRHGRKRESKVSGCFKCGASDHIARDCSQATKSKENASNYVLKEDNRQRGGSHHRYDMVFDDDPGTGRRSHGDKTGSGSKKQKIENHRSEDSVQKGHNTRHSDSRNYKNRHEYEDRGRHRETDVHFGDRSRDDDHKDKAYRRRDTDVHDRDRETERYLDSGRHARREDSSNKKSSDSSQRARDARIDVDTKAVSSLDNGADHDSESRERKKERYGERRENSRHYESSRRGKDGSGRHRSPDLGRSDYDSRDRRHRDDKR